jgi:hypothetical protein
LRAGTVPVYYGAPNIKEFDPAYGTNHTSIIRVEDFATVKELAEFLIDLAKDEERYNQYLAWKTMPPTPRFEELVHRSMDQPFIPCKLCEAVAYMKTRKIKH